MSQPISVSSRLVRLICAGHDQSPVPAIAPRLTPSRQSRRVSFPNPFPTQQDARAAASASPGRQAGASSSERTRVTGTDPPIPVSDGSAATTDSVVRAHDHRHPSTTSRWRHRPDRRDSCGHCATIRHWRTRSPYSTSRHRYWVVYSCEAAPSLGRQQADHRLTAGVRLLQRLLPALPRPDPGVRVQIQRISSARPGSCSTGHRCTASPADCPGWND